MRGMRAFGENARMRGMRAFGESLFGKKLRKNFQELGF